MLCYDVGMSNETQIIPIAKRIALLRKESGMTQDRYAREILGRKQSTVSAKESGEIAYSPRDIVLTAQAFHVSTDYIYGLTDDPSPKLKEVTAA